MSLNIGPWAAQEQHRGRIAQISENTARLAQSYSRFDSTGFGEFRHPLIVDFQLTFIEKPIVAHGYDVDGEALVDTRFPRCHGFVYKWRTDSKGFYTGCWLAFVVDTQSSFITTTKPEPGYTVTHHFTFTGVAMKDLPAFLLEI